VVVPKDDNVGLPTDMDVVFYTLKLPGSFGSVRNLRRYSGRSELAVKEYLAEQDAYMLHKPRRVRFPRRKTYSKGIAGLYQINLVDVTNLSSFNDGMRYILTSVDVFSKQAWAVPVRMKADRDVANSFEKNLSDGKPNMVQSDKGTEFLNSTFQSMLKRHGIKFYTSENEDLKAAVVERFNRTLKMKMFRYLTFKNTKRYVDILAHLLHSYNNTYHRSIGMTPSEVNEDNEDEVRARLHPLKPKT